MTSRMANSFALSSAIADTEMLSKARSQMRLPRRLEVVSIMQHVIQTGDYSFEAKLL